MNKKFFLVTIGFFVLLNHLIFGFSAEEKDISSYDYIKLKIKNDISFYIDFEDKYDVEKFSVDSFFLPITYNGSQYLNNFNSSSEYVIVNDSNELFLRFDIKKNKLSENNYILNEFVVESTYQKPLIKDKIDYPLISIDKEYTQYLNFTELIDFDYEIQKQASLLAEGEDDVFIIASKIAKWIREDVIYDLSTITNNPNQKSSETFKLKTGVCKEISNLYISMMRTLGIPCRVVSGYAYTDSKEIVEFINSNWGGHAWVEVLIGDQWVPFDLTYNQYGYVDSTHIALYKGVELKKNSLYIDTFGYGYSFKKQSFVNNSFEILDKMKYSNEYDFSIEITGPNEIGFDSYGYLKIDVKNKLDEYNILFLNIISTQEVEILDKDYQMHIFRPNQEQTMYFRYKLLSDKMKDDYTYTIPFKLYNNEIEKDFFVKTQKDFLNIKKIALPEEYEVKKNYSNNDLIFDCNFIYDMPKNLILCSMKNPNNFEINNLNVCINSQTCTKIALKINEMASVAFETENESEEIFYSYSNITNSLILNLAKPLINVDYSIENESLIINYSIQNFNNKIKVNIYDDKKNVLLKSFNSHQKENIVIPLDKGHNNITLKMEVGDNLIDSNEFNIELEKSFFDIIYSFIIYIKNLVMDLF